jgi:hypothetical protein
MHRRSAQVIMSEDDGKSLLPDGLVSTEAGEERETSWIFLKLIGSESDKKALFHLRWALI